MIEFDQHLLVFINSHNSPFWDMIMYAISGKLIWAPLYIAILVALYKKYQRKFYIIALFIALSVLCADQGSVQLFKNTFHRLRPCHEPALAGMVHLVKGRCGGQYGFISSHASNSFNVALLSLLLIRRRWFSISMISWALIVGFSRIYLGVHYPGDVLCGSIFGALVGWGIYNLYILTDKKILSTRPYFMTS